MAKKTHNYPKDIRKLAKAILRYSTMPAEGAGKYLTDMHYLRDYVVPLAKRMKKHYTGRRKAVQQTVKIILILLPVFGGAVHGQGLDTAIGKQLRGMDSQYQSWLMYYDTMSVRSTIEFKPCQIDTIKGILIWHSRSEMNYGNVWDTGYWIGPCGPTGINTGDLFFVPGIERFNSWTCLDPKCKVIKYKEVPIVREGFQDSRFRRIPARHVYGLIVIRQKDSKSIAVMPLPDINNHR